MSGLVLRSLTLGDADAVARLHRESFPSSLLTAAGQGPTRRYYTWQLIGHHDIHPVGAFSGEQLIGFCIAGYFRGAMSGFLRRHAPYLALRALVTPQVWLHPEIRDRLRIVRHSFRRTERALNRAGAQASTEGCFSILSIAVDLSKERNGIGSALLADAEGEARRRGSLCLSLTVDPRNSRAISFYQTRGWTREGSGEAWTGAMKKPLDS